MVQHIHQRTKESNKKNCERSWRKYKQQHQWQAYTKERNVYNSQLIYHKKQTISKKVDESNTDTKQLFHLINNITMSKTANPMPEGKIDAQLGEIFLHSFLKRLKKNQTTILKH